MKRNGRWRSTTKLGVETPAKELLHRALTLAGVRAAVLVLSSVAFLSCAPTGESSGPVYYAPSPNLDEEDPCVAVYERFMAATEEGDVATLRALTADWEECSGPGQVGVVLGPSGAVGRGLNLVYWVGPIVVAVVIGNAIYDALRTIVRRRND